MTDALAVALSSLPILILIVALGVCKIPAHWASPIALLSSALIALWHFGMPMGWVGTAALEGAALGLWPIMLVIVSAIYTHKLATHSGALDRIKSMLAAVSPDRRVQVLLLAWGFGGFLEAVAGYGTAVAIPASILIALGFEPIFAAVICLIANTVPTAYGAVGIAVSTLAQVTDLDQGRLSWTIALQLSPFIVLVPLILVAITGAPDTRPGRSPRSIRRGPWALKGLVGISLASGLAFALPQFLVARFIGPELPSLIGSLCSMLSTIALARMRKGRGQADDSQAQGSRPPDIGLTPSLSSKERGSALASLSRGLMAWLPYILISLTVILTSPMCGPINAFLSKASSHFVIYSGQGAKAQAFKWIVTPGALIMFSAICYACISRIRPGKALGLFGQTLWGLRYSFVTVLSILAMAKVMAYSGMTTALASALASFSGGLYPLVSSLVGALGTFVTGSDTSSNILFGRMQVEAAARVGIDPFWLASANTSGATAGKMISPQSIAVATGATGLVGKEGLILRRTVGFCLAYVVVLGILILCLAQAYALLS